MRSFLWALALATIVGCLDTSVSTDDQPHVSVAKQALSTCTSDCDPPIYDGNPVSCATPDFCMSDANGVDCRYFNYSIHISCQPNLCGNDICDAGETFESCPADCTCGNGTCDDGEIAHTCPTECRPVCGDGYCDSNETPQSCWADCG
jgi:hypothetical protein